MKKIILSAMAAGALAFGGAASAQDLGDVLSNILGFGQPSYSSPAVVAGTQQYRSVYSDEYGRQIGIDQNGNHVLIQGNSNFGRCGIVGYNAYGQPIYGPTRIGGYSCPYTTSSGMADRDGDGVADARDRWPSDRRYW